jgi:hypothetical protein
LCLWLVFTPFVAHPARLCRAAGRPSIQDRWTGSLAMSLIPASVDELRLWTLEVY